MSNNRLGDESGWEKTSSRGEMVVCENSHKHTQTTVARYNTALRVLRVWRCDLGGAVNAAAAASGGLDHQPHPKTHTHTHTVIRWSRYSWDLDLKTTPPGLMVVWQWLTHTKTQRHRCMCTLSLHMCTMIQPKHRLDAAHVLLLLRRLLMFPVRVSCWIYRRFMWQSHSRVWLV